MLPGPTLVKQCPSCQGLYKQRTISSGNTCRAKYYTDGKMDAPMLPRTPGLIKCPHCHTVLWSNKPVQVDSFHTYLGHLIFDEDKSLREAKRAEAEGLQMKYDNTPFFDRPTFDDLLQFAESQVGDEVLIRTTAWLVGNDSRRKSDSPIPLSKDETQNLRRLVDLLSHGDHGYSPLVLAEALRELGRLDEAKTVIEADDPSSDEEYTAQFILELIEAGDTQVCEVTQDDEREWRANRRKNRRLAAQFPLEISFDPMGPAVFEIESKDWWFKVISMCCHNWALIERQGEGATVFFFHDLGHTKGGVKGYRHAQLMGRSAVVDSLEFSTLDQALLELDLNGFKRLEEHPGPWDGMEPAGHFFDARGSEKGVYSRSGRWVTEQSLIDEYERAEGLKSD